MEDLIKRSDAAEVVYKALKTPPLKRVLTDTMSLAIALARDIPSADRPQEWIPCSERLPSEDEDVMAWVESGDEARIACCNYTKEVWFDAIMDVIVSPIAWMPLPRPWKGADDE